MQIEVFASARSKCFAIFLLSFAVSNVAHAEPIWLQCQATGHAGSFTFRFSFDEATQQATAVWAGGGGRPSAPLLGETGTDQSMQDLTSITPSVIEAPFRTGLGEGREYAYRVGIDRNTSAMGIRRYPEGRDSLYSVGACQRAESPRAF